MVLITLNKARNLILLDTCYIVSILDNKHLLEHVLHNDKFATTSFNIEELKLVKHKLKHEEKHTLHKFLLFKDFKIIDIGIKPGEKEKERDYVKNFDPELLKLVHDPSDAVLLVTAIKTHSNIITKDKHHLFTSVLNNYIQQYNISVYKTLRFTTH